MNFTEKDLLLAQKKGVIPIEVFVALLDFLRDLHKNEAEVITSSVSPSPAASLKTQKKKFTIENFLYYFGAFIIIQTMGWYLGIIWGSHGSGGLFAICILYFIIFTLVGNFLWKKDKKTPGGLLYACAVSIVPLGVWAFENLVGIMPDSSNEYADFHIWVRSGWILMEIATIFAGLIFLKFRKFPFLTLPICYSAWYLSMDIVPLCLGSVSAPTWGMRNFASVVFALLLVGFAMKYDRKTKEDYSLWLYIFGATMFWFSILSIMFQLKLDNELAYFIFAVFSFVYMVLSVIIQRKIFMVWGVFGVFGYIGHLTYAIFKDSVLFPFALTLFGLAIILFGTYYAKNCDKFEQQLRNLVLPKI